ncbi:hypothetical protein, partial [Marinobacterium halophilum]|uniref:hypothetical protein n=1 Tax=Marinobacterium halophilum TaxID=267374 RepID=UPI001B7FFFF1
STDIKTDRVMPRRIQKGYKTGLKRKKMKKTGAEREDARYRSVSGSGAGLNCAHKKSGILMMDSGFIGRAGTVIRTGGGSGWCR